MEKSSSETSFNVLLDGPSGSRPPSPRTEDPPVSPPTPIPADDEKTPDPPISPPSTKGVPVLPATAFPAWYPQNAPVFVQLPNGQTQMVLTFPTPSPVYAAQDQQPKFVIQPNLNTTEETPEEVEAKEERYSLSLACLLAYVIGVFSVLPYYASIILSLHMWRKGLISTRKKSGEVFLLSLFELLISVGFLVAAFGPWSYVEKNCNIIHEKVNGHFDSLEQCDTIWYGWIALAGGYVICLIFGIPRVHFCWQSRDASQVPLVQPPATESRPVLARACAITYILGILTFVPHLASIAVSLHMWRKDLIVGHIKSGIVLAFSVFELIVWAACAGTAWFFTKHCHDVEASKDNSAHTVCETAYWGWISIVTWVVLAIVLGFIRVIICWKARKASVPQSSDGTC